MYGHHAVGVVECEVPAHPAAEPEPAPVIYTERRAAGEAEGALVLVHGRGSDEHDLLGLADVLDPARTLHVVTPRAPLALNAIMQNAKNNTLV